MAYEVDYLAVGDGERSGDAIALRFFLSDVPGQTPVQKVVVIDGGFKDSGKQLIKHIKDYYGTSHADIVFLTHADADHASGLTEVLEGMTVGTLVMHKPWEHADPIRSLFKDGKLTSSRLGKKLEDGLQHASDLVALAEKKKISVVEPFTGVQGYNFRIRVLGPSKEYYRLLLSQFDCTPEAKASLGFLEPIKESFQEAAQWVDDHMHLDLFDDEDRTRSENNSSTIILFELDSNKILFTGDAGVTALTQAIGYANSLGIDLTNLSLLHAPHHGSKRNLGRSVLKKIKGQQVIISASKDSKDHPAGKVVNAFKKHGSKVYATQGNNICFPNGTPARLNWSSATELQFSSRVKM